MLDSGINDLMKSSCLPGNLTDEIGLVLPIQLSSKSPVNVVYKFDKDKS